MPSGSVSGLICASVSHVYKEENCPALLHGRRLQVLKMLRVDNIDEMNAKNEEQG